MSGGIHAVVSGARASRVAVECLESRTLFNAGDPDLSFGVGGVTAPAAPALANFFQVVEQPDHRLVALGNFNDDLVVARYLPNGTIDSSYDGDGWKTFTPPPNFGQVVAAWFGASRLPLP